MHFPQKLKFKYTSYFFWLIALNVMWDVSTLHAIDMSVFFKQKTEFTVINKRLDLFQNLLTSRKVLHVGCTDFPIFNPLTSLHLELAKFVGELDGCDVDEEGIDLLRKYFDGTYFTSLSDVDKSYDYVLVPEVIEHVGNIEEFLHLLDTVKTDYYIISAPNAFFPGNMQIFNMTGDNFCEEVHPDHNCWFSPYTLRNCIQKYTTWKVQGVYLLECMSMVAVVCKK